MKTALEISAGGVIYRRAEDRTEVCLISTQGGKTWQLPKGLIERGEPAEEAARREVEEETGLQGDLEERLDKIEYWYVASYTGERTRIHKIVYFFLFLCTGGDTSAHDEEVDEARWFPLAEAVRQLSFENERRVMKRAAGLLAHRGAA